MLAGDNGGCDHCDCFLVMEQTVGEKHNQPMGLLYMEVLQASEDVGMVQIHQKFAAM